MQRAGMRRLRICRAQGRERLRYAGSKEENVCVLHSYISCFLSPLNPPILNSSSSSLHFVALEELDRPLDCVSRTIQGGLGSFFRRWFRSARKEPWAATLRVVQEKQAFVVLSEVIQGAWAATLRVVQESKPWAAVSGNWKIGLGRSLVGGSGDLGCHAVRGSGR